MALTDKKDELILENSDLSNFEFHDRRYVGNKETFAYLLNDVSNAFNINGYKDRSSLE